jgi:hypothetical protein
MPQDNIRRVNNLDGLGNPRFGSAQRKPFAPQIAGRISGKRIAKVNPAYCLMNACTSDNFPLDADYGPQLADMHFVSHGRHS